MNQNDNTYNENIKDIDQLINALTEEITRGNFVTAKQAEKEKTQSYWAIGRLIQTHLDFHKHERHYARKMYSTITKKFRFNKRNLYYAVQLFKTYKEQDEIDFRIGWSQFCILMTVNPQSKREELERLIIDKKLTIKQLQQLVKHYRIEAAMHEGAIIERNPGLIHHYKVIRKYDRPVIDLGFYTSHNRFPAQDTFDTKNHMLKITMSDTNYTYEPVPYDKSVLYTYTARVLHVIDGDTILVDINLGFDTSIIEKLRLRGIDTPSILTNKGIQAREFVKEQLDGIDFIVIKTYHKDFYNRFVADIYYDPAYIDPAEIMKKGTFLNQKLLDEKHAVLYTY